MRRAGMGWYGMGRVGRTREVGETGQGEHAVESTSRKEVVEEEGNIHIELVPAISSFLF